MKTDMFRLGRGRCYLFMLMEQAPGLGWAMLALSLVLAVAGFFYSPWAGLVALGVDAFIVVTGMSFVIMAHGMNSMTGANMAMHSLEITGNKVRVEFEDGKYIDLDRGELQPYRIYPGGIIIPVGGSRKGWLWIPPSAFAGDDDFKVFVKEIYESNTEQEQKILLHDGDGGAGL